MGGLRHRRCTVCESDCFSDLGKRRDGLKVLGCESCGMGVVETMPMDTVDFYADGYYGSEAHVEGVGYTDYSFTAEHGTAWAAAFVPLLKPGGRVLDIGCVDGHLLKKFGPEYERFGIEVNAVMAVRARQAGVTVLGQDLFDPAIQEHHASNFDVVTAIAVFEHLTDIRQGMAIALDLLKDDGILVFEVPLLSAIHDNRVWFESSLEHIFYPSQRAIEYLVRDALQRYLVGGEVHVQGYGSTYVGVVFKDLEAAERFLPSFDRLADPDGVVKTEEERLARFLFLVVHAATCSQSLIDDLAILPLNAVNRPLLKRLSQLWGNDYYERAAVETALTRVQDGLDETRAEDLRLNERLNGALAEAQRGSPLLERAYHELADVETALKRVQDGFDKTKAENLRLNEQLDAALAEAQRGAMLLQLACAKLDAPAVAELRAEERLAKASEALERFERRSASFERSIEDARRKVLRQRGAAVRLFEPRWFPDTPIVESGEPWPTDCPLVSVVIPCFNYGRFVVEAVDSVLAQTFKDLEIIVVEGGSTDSETRKVVADLERPRTRTLFQDKPHPVGANRNFGISHARGKYICCLDADDLLRPTYIEKAVFLAETYQYDVVSCALQFFGDQDEFTGILRHPNLADLLKSNHVLVCALARRSLWWDAGGYRDTDRKTVGYIYEDWMFWVRVAALGARFHNIADEALFLYRKHGPSQSSLEESLDRQREYIALLNADVVDGASIERSAHLAAADRRAEEPLRNLVGRSGSKNVKPVLLLAMPFTILGGAERLLSGVMADLAMEGWRVVIVTTLPTSPEHGDTTAWFEKATTEIFHLPRFLEIERWDDFIRYVFASRRVDLLCIVGSAYFYDLLPRLKAQCPQLKVADILFNTVGHVANNRKHAAVIDVNLVENSEVFRWLVQNGESEDRIKLVTSGVDLDRFRPTAPCRAVLDRLGARGGDLIVGFSGRWSAEKGPLDFVEIARRLDPRLPVRFVMTGAGQMRKTIEDAIADADFPPKRFNLVGEVPEIGPYLGSYDLLVLPSHYDGRPVVVLEALAMGVPVLASRVGALPELIADGENGYLCDPTDINGFVERLTLLAQSPETLARLRTGARTYAEQHLDQRGSLQRYRQTFAELLGLNPP